MSLLVVLNAILQCRETGRHASLMPFALITARYIYVYRNDIYRASTQASNMKILSFLRHAIRLQGLTFDISHTEAVIEPFFGFCSRYADESDS